MQAADNPRLRALLGAPIGPLLSRLAAPNIVVLTVQTLVTIADAWFVGRLGVTALASLAIVFPVQTMMLMMSAGAMGGGISSAVARALGAGDQARADAITLHAIVIAVLMAAIQGGGESNPASPQRPNPPRSTPPEAGNAREWT